MHDNKQELRIRHHNQLILLRPQPQKLHLIALPIELLSRLARVLDKVPHQPRNRISVPRALLLSLGVGTADAVGRRLAFFADVLGGDQACRADDCAGVAREDQGALDAGALREAREESGSLF